MSSRPAIMRRAVDLPHPLGPTKTTNSPSGMSRFMPLTATTSSPKTLVTFSIVTSAISPPPFVSPTLLGPGLPWFPVFFPVFLELPSIGWQLFALVGSQSDSTASFSSLDTYATRLLTEPLSSPPLRFGTFYPNSRLGTLMFLGPEQREILLHPEHPLDGGLHPLARYLP